MIDFDFQKGWVLFMNKVFAILLLMLTGCLPKTYFNQSFSAPERVPVTKDGYVALPDGENFDGGIILETEGITPKDINIIKVHGTYLVAASGFKSVWAIFPVSGDKAKVKRISLLKENETFSDVQFEVSSKTRCVIMKFNVGEVSRSVYIDRDGDVDEKRCDDD